MQYLALAQRVLGESRADPQLCSNFDPDLNPDPDLYILVMQNLEKNKLAKLQATLVRNYDLSTD